MGGADCICSDKTGTLTRNEMDVVKIWCKHKEVINISINNISLLLILIKTIRIIHMEIEQTKLQNSSDHLLVM